MEDDAERNRRTDRLEEQFRELGIKLHKPLGEFSEHEAEELNRRLDGEYRRRVRWRRTVEVWVPWLAVAVLVVLIVAVVAILAWRVL